MDATDRKTLANITLSNRRFVQRGKISQLNSTQFLRQFQNGRRIKTIFCGSVGSLSDRRTSYCANRFEFLSSVFDKCGLVFRNLEGPNFWFVTPFI